MAEEIKKPEPVVQQAAAVKAPEKPAEKAPEKPEPEPVPEVVVVATFESEEDAEYTLKKGREHHGIKSGEHVVYKEGDKVTLSPAQYAAFKDKFEAPTA